MREVEQDEKSGMIHYDGSMELPVKTPMTCDHAEWLLKQHESTLHPEIQCQCLECLYARELIAQQRAWKEVR